MTTRDAIQAAFSNILKDYDVKEAYVFGSYARGDQTPDSDVDIVSAKPHQMRSSFYDSIKDEEVLLYEAG